MATGLHGYDAATFERAKPLVGSVCVRPLMSTLRQTMPRGVAPPYEVTVPPFDRHVLVIARSARGVVEGRVDGRFMRYERRSDQVTLMPAGVDSWWASGSGAARELMHVHLSPELFDDFVDAGTLRPMVGQMQPDIVRVSSLLLDELEAGEPPALYWDVSARYMAALVARQLGRSERRVAQGGLTPRQQRRVVDYIRARFHEDVTLQDLAGLVDLSPFHFARAFKRSMGVAPHRYLMTCRLEAAEALLRDTELSVAEIALRVGYETPTSLNRLFVKSMGKTPAAYRRALD